MRECKPIGYRLSPAAESRTFPRTRRAGPGVGLVSANADRLTPSWRPSVIHSHEHARLQKDQPADDRLGREAIEPLRARR